MTRINLVDPQELTDQHLFAEFREIRRMPAYVIKSMQFSSLAMLLHRIPDEYRLGTGHVTFFYDKGEFLRKRYLALQAELDKRQTHNYNQSIKFDETGVFYMPQLNNDYIPSQYALKLSRQRLAERISAKPQWYKHCGKPLIKETSYG